MAASAWPHGESAKFFFLSPTRDKPRVSVVVLRTFFFLSHACFFFSASVWLSRVSEKFVTHVTKKFVTCHEKIRDTCHEKIRDM